MKVSLPLELERFVNDEVASGRYESASDVIRDALHLLEDREELRRIRLERLRQDIAVGIAEADRGDLAPFDLDEILAEAHQRHAKTKGARHGPDTDASSAS